MERLSTYWSLVGLVGLLTMSFTEADWVNSYDNPFEFTCQPGTFLSLIVSQHQNAQEDRIFDMSCGNLPTHGTGTGTVDCHWSPYVNNFDQPVVYQCPGEGYIAGLSSYHSNRQEDRRYRFYCCQIPLKKIRTCQYTGWENNWDGLLVYNVPHGKILRGMISFHRNQAEDRRFQFEVCDFTSD